MTFKRMVSFFATVAILFTSMPAVSLPFGASAATSGTTGSCTWTLDGTQLTISGNGGMTAYTSSFAAPWGTGITKVTIEEGVTAIGAYAFNKCTALTEVSIPSSVKSIGNNVFNGCEALTDVNLVDLAKWCGISFSNTTSNPLYYAKNLCVNGVAVSDVTIPDTVTRINDYAFYQYGALRSVDIPDSVTYIGNYAFYTCENLAEVRLPNGVGAILSHTFEACTSLTRVTIPSSVTSIGNSAFRGCSSLQEAILPSSVTSLEGHAFRECTALKAVTFSDGVKSIGDYAFFGCTALENVSLPESLTQMGIYVFSGCYSLRSAVLPSGITVIGGKTFSDCTALTDVNIPHGVTQIGYDAFNGCSSLTDIVIPDTVTKVGYAAFAGCTSLTEAVIPGGVTTIEQATFSKCKALSKVTLSNGVKSIGYGAFGECSALREIIIPNSVISIGEYAFEACNSLTKIVLPSSVTTIGGNAFCDCKALTEVVLSNGVTTIGTRAFYFCTALKHIVLPRSVKSVGKEAFQGCLALETVWYEGSSTDRDGITVESVNTRLTDAAWTYNGCKSGHIYLGDCDVDCLYCGKVRGTTVPHTFVNAMDTLCDVCLTTREIPDELSGHFAYKVVSGSAMITGCVTTAEGDIVIPDTLDGYPVIGIGDNAFYGCRLITSVTIPSGVVQIADNAFTTCTALKRIEVAEDNEQYCSSSGVLYNKEKTAIICKPKNHTLYVRVHYTYQNGDPALSSVEKSMKPGETYRVDIPDIIGYSAQAANTVGVVQDEDITIDVVYYENPRLGSGACNAYITWTAYEKGLLVFRGTGDMPDYTSQGTPWYAWVGEINEVYIDPRITSIGAYAFEDCAALTFVECGYSIASVGAYAFSGCASLRSFSLSDSVTVVGDHAFEGCRELVQVMIDGKLTAIGNEAFAACDKLTQVYFRSTPPVSFGDHALGSTVGKYVFYYRTVEGWDEAIVDGRWNGYEAIPYNAIAKADFDGTNVYIIKVVDKHNLPLSNAVVTLGEEVESTNKDGMAYFVKPTTAESLTVSCSDHVTFTDAAFSASAVQAMDIIELSDKPSVVQGVRLNGKSIATSVEIIDCGADTTAEIVVNGYSKYAIWQYELYQGNRLLSTVKTDETLCTFSVKANVFEEDETVFVKMYTTDGQTSATALNIDVIRLAAISEQQILDELSSLDLTFSLGDMGNFKVPMSFTATGDETFYTSVKGRTIRVGINLDIGSLLEEEDDDLPKGTLQRMVDAAMKKSAKGKAGFEYTLCGYLEIDYLGNGEYYVKTNYVKVGMTANMAFNAQASWYGVVGVYFKAQLSASSTLNMIVSRYEPEAGFGVEDMNFGMEAKLGVAGGAYVLWGFGSAELYADAQMGFVVGLVPKPEVESVYISGEFGVKWSLFWGLRRGQHVIATGDIYRYPAQTYLLRSLSAELYAAQQDPSSYEWNDRSYLQERSEWQSGEYLQTHIYDQVSPEIVTCGDTVMMLWLDDNRERADADFQTLYYALYEDGVWSEPKAVADNGTFDCEFDVYTDGDTIYVVYTDMAVPNASATMMSGDEEDMAAVVGGVEVSVTAYKNGAFGEPVRLTDNEECELLPRVTAVDGVLTVAWVQAATVGSDGQTADNTVCVTVRGETGWSEPERSLPVHHTVSDLATVKLGNAVFTAYVTDLDGSAETKDDLALVLVGENGQAAVIDTGLITDVKAEQLGDSAALTWHNNGRIYAVTDAEEQPICLVPEGVTVGTDYRIVSLPDGRILLTVTMGDAEKGGTDVYGIYMDKNGSLTFPVRLTVTDGYVNTFDTVFKDDRLVTVFTEAAVDMTGGTVETVTHLRSEAIALFTDITLDRVDFELADAKAGAPFVIMTEVTNNGTDAIDGVIVNLLDNDGEPVYTTALEATLSPGASAVYAVSVALPTSLSTTPYYVEVLPQTTADDANPDDNRAAVTLGFADLCVAAQQKIIGEKNALVVAVTNNGNVTSSADVTLYAPDTDGRELGFIAAVAVAPGDTAQFFVELSVLTNADDERVTCVVTSTVNDPYPLNNTESVTLLHIQEDVFKTDPEQTGHNPEISENAVVFDKYAPQDIAVAITAKAAYFTGIEGLTKGTDFTVADHIITIPASYLGKLDNDEHTFKLLFDFGYDEPTVRTLSVTVTDTTPVNVTGQVDIRGEAVVGNTVYADLSALEPSQARVSYRWSIDGVTVSTTDRYTLAREDGDKTLTLTACGINGYVGEVKKAVVVALKKPPVPPVPMISMIDSNSFAVVKVEGTEYSLDLETWQDSAVFDNLSPYTAYTVYARRKATDTDVASDSTVGVTVTTDKLTVAAPEAPQWQSRSYNTIELVADPLMEYKIEGGEWTDDPVFTGLAPSTTYTFYQRYKETDIAHAGASSTAALTTADLTVLEGHVAISGEVALTRTVSADISALTPTEANLSYCWTVDGVVVSTEKQYTIVRADYEKTLALTVRGIDGYDGEFTVEAVVTKCHLLKPNAPIIVKVDSTSFIAVTYAYMEYSLDLETWQDSGAFDDLSPNTTYTVYVRWKETDLHYTSEHSDGTEVTTDKLTLDAPEAPQAQRISSDTIELIADWSMEYKIEDGEWTDDPVFTGLAPNTTYTFYQRYKETDVQYTSDTSVGATITTDKLTVGAPHAPQMFCNSYNTIELVADSSMEYKIEGGEWTDDPVFTGLAPSTAYTFYQRYKETAIAHAGASSTAALTTADLIALDGAVTIVGEPQGGQTLTVDLTSTNGDANEVTYQWYSDGVAVSGAVGATYTVTKDDMGKTLTVRVTGVRAYTGELTATVPIDPYVLGDITMDVVINMRDVMTLYQYVGGATAELDDLPLRAARITDDDEINMRDVMMLYRFVGGSIDSLR